MKSQNFKNLASVILSLAIYFVDMSRFCMFRLTVIYLYNMIFFYIKCVLKQ